MSRAFLSLPSPGRMKVMKVLYIITKSEPMGGAQKYVYDLSRALLSENIDVSVALGGAGRLKELLGDAGITTHSINSLQRNIHVFKEIAVFFEIMRLCRTLSPDIVHLNSSKAGGLGALAIRLLNIVRGRKGQKKIVSIFTAHGWAFTEERPAWQKILIFHLHLLTVYLANTTIAVSDHTKEEIISPSPTFLHTSLNKRIVSIPNGISPFDVLNIREARKSLIEKTRLRGSVDLWSTQTLWIGSIAELHPNKGVDVAIEALSRISPEFSKHKVSLVYFIIGDGDQREEIEKLIHRRRLDSVVFLVGYIPEARKYLSAFDIYLLPSRKEGLPGVVLEAGKAGIPVIATPVGGVPEVIENGQNGIITPPNPQSIGDAILNLAKDTAKRVELSKNLKEKLESKFSGDEMIIRTIRLYLVLT